MTQPITVPEGTCRRLAARAFAAPRPYTVARTGVLELLLHVLRERGLHEEREALHAALTPLLSATGAMAVAELPEALEVSGRPVRAVSQALVSRALVSALDGSVQALGWSELVPSLALWAPDGGGELAVEGVAVSADGRVARREALMALTDRAQLIMSVWRRDGSGGEIRSSDALLDGRTLAGVGRVLGLPLNGVPLGDLPAGARYGNRVGRALAGFVVSRLPGAVRAGLPPELLQQALAGVAAVAEAVRLDGATDRRGRLLAVPSNALAPAVNCWSPMVWWPVLDAWGAPTKKAMDRLPTRWLLTPEHLDAALWLLCYAAALVGAAAESCGQRGSSEPLAEFLRDRLDVRWAAIMQRVWGVSQSKRSVTSRVPFPSVFAEGGQELTKVVFGRPATLPWGEES